MLLKIFMIPNQISNAILPSIAGVTTVILLFFLPAIIELKKPKDAGPRIIGDSPAKVTLSMLKIPLIDIEEGQEENYQSAMKNAAFLYFIPNMEF
ncbi:MAG TPA: hypothetical protein VK536_04845 [Candidatus Limnocylindrales bacterium]|nr:hypothetical protein [Candidatus Limnocylindrales bacterium]